MRGSRGSLQRSLSSPRDPGRSSRRARAAAIMLGTATRSDPFEAGDIPDACPRRFHGRISKGTGWVSTQPLALFAAACSGLDPTHGPPNNEKVPVPRCRPRGDSPGSVSPPCGGPAAGFGPQPLALFRRGVLGLDPTHGPPNNEKVRSAELLPQRSHPWDCISSFSEKEIFWVPGSSKGEDRMTSRSSLRASSLSPLISPLSTSRRSTPKGAGRQM